MYNEHDDDKRPKRPLSERIKDGSYTPPLEIAKLAGHFKEDERMQRLAAAIPLLPSADLGRVDEFDQA